MAISKEERERFQRLIRDLRKIETDNPGTPEQRRRLLAIGNRLRESAGLPPLHDEYEEEIPEIGFYQRARALGMVRDRSQDS